MKVRRKRSFDSIVTIFVTILVQRGISIFYVDLTTQGEMVCPQTFQEVMRW